LAAVTGLGPAFGQDLEGVQDGWVLVLKGGDIARWGAMLTAPPRCGGRRRV